MKLVYEVNGKWVLRKSGGGLKSIPAKELDAQAIEIAKKHGVPLSDVSMRFVEE